MPEGYFFKVPAPEARKIILRSALFFGAIVVGLTIVFGNRYVDVALLLVLCHVIGYFYLLRHKFVFVSPGGIQGESFLGRTVHFLWHEELHLREQYSVGIPGYSIQKSPLESIFIPRAIVASPQFRNVIAQFASNHALLSATHEA